MLKLLLKRNLNSFVLIFIPILIGLLLIITNFSLNIHKFLIENIKSFVPTYYFYSYKFIEPLSNNVSHFKAGFVYSYDGFTFYINNEKKVINDITIYSFNIKYIPYILAKYKHLINRNQNVIFLDITTYNYLKAPDNIKVKNKKDEYIKLKVIPIEILIRKPVILIPHNMSCEILPFMVCSNIVAVKSKSDLNDNLVDIYNKKGIKLHYWEENIPLFFKYLSKLINIIIIFIQMAILLFLSIIIYISSQIFIQNIKKFSILLSMYGFSITKNILYINIVLIFIFLYISFFSTILYIFIYNFLENINDNILKTNLNILKVSFLIFLATFVISNISTTIFIKKWRYKINEFINY